MKKLDQSGAGIIQIMVIVGVVGSLSVGVMNIVKNISKKTKLDHKERQQKQATRQIYNLLRSRSACIATLSDKFIEDTNFDIKDPNGNSVFIPYDHPSPPGPATVFGKTDKAGVDSSPTQITLKKTGFAATRDWTSAGNSGPWFVQESGLPNTIRALFRINYFRGNLAKAESDANYKQLLQSTTGGGLTSMDSFEIVLTRDPSTLKITECYASDPNYENYISNFCEGRLDGTVDIDDGLCKSIQIKAVTDKPAITATSLKRPSPVPTGFPSEAGVAVVTKGKIEIQDNGATESSLRVGKPKSIPTPPATINERGNIATAGNVGIGMDPKTNDAVASNDGYLDVKYGIKAHQSLAVGANYSTPDFLGNAVFEGGVSIGTDEATNAGQAYIFSRLGIGTAGNPNNFPNTKVNVLGSATINTIVPPYIDPIPSVTYKNQGLVVGGNISIKNQLVSDSDLSHAATIGWVSNHIATALSPFAVDINNRIQNIIQQDASTLYAAIESAICNKIRLDNNGDSGCNFVSSGYTLAGALNPAAGATSQEIHLVKAAPAAMTSIVSFRASCRDSGVCDQLCINGTCKTAWPSMSVDSSICAGWYNFSKLNVGTGSACTSMSCSGATCSCGGSGTFVSSLSLTNYTSSCPSDYVATKMRTTSNTIQFYCCRLKSGT